MSELPIPGYPLTWPAGYATLSLAGGFPNVTLDAAKQNADIIEFTGLLTIQDITVILPPPPFPTQVVSTSSFSGPVDSGWTKIFRNSTTGAFAVFVQNQGAASSIAIPAGGSLIVYSPDGVRVLAAAAGTGAGSDLATYRATATGNNATALALPGVAIGGLVVTQVFDGSNIGIEVLYGAKNSVAATGVIQVQVFVDGIAVNPISQSLSPVNGADVTGSLAFQVANPIPGTPHTITVHLGASGAGDTSTLNVATATEWGQLIVQDLA